MSSTLDFPLFIWNIIIPDLSTQDIITLRSVNKDLYHTLGHNEVWKPIVLQNWFHSDYNDGYENIIGELHNVDDFAKYFRKRSKIDYSIEKSLNQIASCNDLPANKQEALKIVRLGHRAIPSLFKVRSSLGSVDDEQHSTASNTTITTTTAAADTASEIQLSLRYYAELILKTIIKDRFLINLYNLEEKYDLNDAELFLLDLSKSDRAFLNLISIRNKRITQIIEKVKQSPLYHHSKPSTFKVSLIIKAFNEIVIPRYTTASHEDGDDEGDDDRFGPNYESCSENFSILRIYSGEVPGDTVLKLAIIQKLAKILAIESVLSESFLIIQDDSFHQGQSYLSLTPTNGFKIYTFNYLFDRITRTRIRNPFESLQLMTKPLTLVELRDRFCRDLQNTVSLSHKTNRQPGSLSYFELYPFSKVEFSKDDVNYIIEYNNALSIQQQSDGPINLRSTKFLELLLNRHQLDLSIFPGYLSLFTAEQSRPFMKRMVSFMNCYEVYQTDVHDETSFQIGDIIKRKNTMGPTNQVHLVFLGETLQRTVKTIPELPTGNLKISDFVKVEKEELLTGKNMNVLDNFIGGFVDLGLFFDTFDPKSFRFKENVRFKGLIHSRKETATSSSVYNKSMY